MLEAPLGCQEYHDKADAEDANFLPVHAAGLAAEDRGKEKDGHQDPSGQAAALIPSGAA